MRAALSFLGKFAVANTLLAAIIIAFNLSSYNFSSQITANLYMPLAILGQAFVLTLLLSIVLSPAAFLPTRIRSWFFGAAAGLGHFLLLVDSQIFSIYRFHIDAFFIKMFFQDFAGLGIGWGTVALGCSALVVSLAAMILLARLINKLSIKPARWLTALLLATLTGQGLHAWGYAHNMRNIIAVNHIIPWYAPLTATSDLQKWGLINPNWVEDNTNIEVNLASNMNYPRQPLVCSAQTTPNIIMVTLESWRFDQLSAEITPNIYAMGEQSLTFDNHLAGGSVTTTGLFSLFYSAPYLYWEGALAKQPALLQALDQLGYQDYILANQDIVVNKLNEAFFKGQEVLQNLPEGSVPAGDAAIVDKLISAIDQQPEAPFFGYLLFNGSHFPYWTPEGYNKPFLPAEMLSISKADKDTDPLPHLNQYSNSIHYLDAQLGRLQQALQARQLWENTIVVITGDHGEEFKDQEESFWGHGSNFTRYQVGVPLVIHWPGKQGYFDYRTSHEDISATLITEALKCNNSIADLTTGRSLFDDEKRTVITTSYVNKAIIQGNTVNELYPGFVKTYSLDSIAEEADTPSGILQEVQRIQSHFR